MSKFFAYVATVVALAVTAVVHAAAAGQARIVSVGGALTETVCALGHEKDLVGVDVTSVYPASVSKVANVGYWRMINAESVLALKPTLVIASDEYRSAPAFAKLQSAGVKVEFIADDNSVEGAAKKIIAVGGLLGKQAKAAELAAKLRKECAAFSAKAAGRKKVVFLYARSSSMILAGGANTPADAMIRLAGAVNGVASMDGYKAVSPEALVSAAPDCIVITKNGLDALGGAQALWSVPGLALTPAGKAKSYVVVDDLLFLGFGPRLGTALAEFGASLARTSGAK